jgi:LPS export ABC transporter protein LptC
MMGMRRLIWLILLALMLSACEEIEEEKPWIQVERPQMLFTDTTLLDSYDKDVLNWKLKTAYLERWADKEIVFVRPVLVDIYDSLGERVAFLRADSGSMDMKFTYVSAFGHVYALTPKGASVRADSLLWNKKDNLVRTESYVRVVSEEGDVLQGKGFESDAKMDHWKILSEVTGIFQDAAKRLKEEDKKESVHLENASSSSVAASSAAVAKQPPKIPGSSASRKPEGRKHGFMPNGAPKRLSPEDSLAKEENRKAREKVEHMKELRAQARQRMSQGDSTKK